MNENDLSKTAQEASLYAEILANLPNIIPTERSTNPISSSPSPSHVRTNKKKPLRFFRASLNIEQEETQEDSTDENDGLKTPTKRSKVRNGSSFFLKLEIEI